MDKSANLIWIDLEMTGLLPESDTIIEIATIVTDPHLEIIAEGQILPYTKVMNCWMAWMNGIPNIIQTRGLFKKLKRVEFQQEMLKYRH